VPLMALCQSRAFPEGAEGPECGGWQVCLAGSMQEDDCATTSHNCWTSGSDAKQFSACKDTFRGFVCQCPAGWPRPDQDPLQQFSVVSFHVTPTDCE
jgi:hypothetical protein